MILEYAARTFHSEESLCRAYKFPYQQFLELKNAGKTLSEIMLELAPQNEKVIVYQGVVYANRKRLCEALGLDYYRYRDFFERTGDVDQAVEFAKIPTVSRKPFVVDGETYKSYTDFCEKSGIPYSTFINMIYVRGMTVEEAKEAYFKSQKNKSVFQYNGKQYPSLRSLCIENGFSYMSIHAQVKQGIPLEEAIQRHLERAKDPKRNGPVFYNGKEYRSLFALTRAFHCSYPRVYAALNRGLSLQEAMANEKGREDPAGKSGNYKSIPITCQGKTYPSLTTLLHENGIASATYYRWKRRMPEEEDPAKIVEAILADPAYMHRKSMFGKVLTIRGKKYATQREVVDKLGISITSITAIMHKQNVSFEEAVEERLRRQEKREKEKFGKQQLQKTNASGADSKSSADEKQNIVIHGKPFFSQQVVCETFHLTPYKIRKTMTNQNLSFSKAVEFLLDGGDPDQSEPVVVNGNSFSSIFSALLAYDIPFGLFQEARSQSSESPVAILEKLIADIPDRTPTPSKRKKYIIHGKTYNSKREALEDAGLNGYKVSNYMNQHQCSFEVAVEMLSDNHNSALT